jgi:hypothetical protein
MPDNAYGFFFPVQMKIVGSLTHFLPCLTYNSEGHHIFRREIAQDLCPASHYSINILLNRGGKAPPGLSCIGQTTGKSAIVVGVAYN